MSLGRYFLVFLGGMAAGAAGLAYLNRDKLDFNNMKSMATDLMSKSMDLKDKVMSRVDAMREDLEDMAAEARDRADDSKTKIAGNPEGLR